MSAAEISLTMQWVSALAAGIGVTALVITIFLFSDDGEPRK